jgi:hypothetical protein
VDEEESDEFDDVMRFEAEQQKSLEGQIVTRMIDSLQNMFTRNNSTSSPNDVQQQTKTGAGLGIELPRTSLLVLQSLRHYFIKMKETACVVFLEMIV